MQIVNQRQKLKKLKRDNKLMRDIINNTPEMARLYIAYNSSPKNVTHTYMDILHFKSKRSVPFYYLNDEMVINRLKKEIYNDLFKLVMDHTEIKMEDEYSDSYNYKCLVGNIFLGVDRR